MTSLVKKKMNNWLAFKMLIQIFKIVSVEWRDVLLNACDIQPFKFYSCDLRPTGWGPC